MTNETAFQKAYKQNCKTISEERRFTIPSRLTYKQTIALKFYKAFGALCYGSEDPIKLRDAEQLRVIRDILFAKYKQFDPDNSFNVAEVDNDE